MMNGDMSVDEILRAAEEAAREVAIREATEISRRTADDLAREALSAELPKVREDYDSGEAMQFRDPPQLEKRVTIMEFPPGPPLPPMKPLMDDQDDVPLAAGGGGGSALPFTASLTITGEGETEETKLSLLGGYYQVGATGEWVEIPATAPTTGTLAYLVFIQTPTGELDEDGAEILITDTPLDPYTAIEEEETSFAVAVPIAEVSGERVIQRRHGNFTLGLWQIDGDAIRWPETVAGSIPPTP